MTDASPGLNLLLVEDEALVAMLVEDALTLHGHTVVGIANTLDMALDIAARERPDLALCDVQLALGDDGVAVARALAERGIPSLFLSGTCPDAGAHALIVGCIAKPFYNAGLGDAVNAGYAISRGEAPAHLPPMLTLY